MGDYFLQFHWLYLSQRLQVLCNIHVHILVQQIIILNAISMVYWNLILFIVQYFHVVLVFFHSILKAPKL